MWILAATIVYFAFTGWRDRDILSWIACGFLIVGGFHQARSVLAGRSAGTPYENLDDSTSKTALKVVSVIAAIFLAAWMIAVGTGSFARETEEILGRTTWYLVIFSTVLWSIAWSRGVSRRRREKRGIGGSIRR